MNDRLRAKPPATDISDWQDGTVVEVSEEDGTLVTIEPTNDGGEEVAVQVTEALYELFSGRVDGEVIGSTVYFIKKNQ